MALEKMFVHFLGMGGLEDEKWRQEREQSDR
jgi:hypothetical protein